MRNYERWMERMKKTDERYEAYLNILKKELVPAFGCTEPIAVAYAAACLRVLLGGEPETLRVEASGNIIKNVKSVIVPNTGGMKGIEAAAAAGIISGREDRQLEVLEELGRMPLPPYIKAELQDQERYQTVYSKVVGSAAAPTAGLHFTPELLEQIQAMGVKLCYVTLHVGLGTFRPVKEEDITDHEMHSEYCVIPQETADIINETKRNGGRVICVGTTSCRTLESWAREDGTVPATGGWTNIFIYPGYRFKAMDALVTNFHLPESTLIMLVSALAGREHILAAYEEAVRQKYRFFSFGDAMLII